VGNLCIIPARGGSKRVPRKNIRDFHGKPIIAYSIEAALASGLFEEVMVSTDDEEISRIAMHYGAKVPFFRSAENADDFATTMDVIQEVLKRYQENSVTFDFVCCIYATAPLVREERLREGLFKLKESNYQTVFPVVAFSSSIWRSMEIDSEGDIKMIWPENLNQRSQDLKKAYHDAGQWYWLNPLSVKDAIYSAHSGAIILEEREAQDIDSLEDWRIAEIKYSLLKESDEKV